MLLLALDTSTHQASLALRSEDTLLGEYSWQLGNNHSVALFRHLQHLLADCSTTMHDVEAIAVATGPGSFQGVRVAVATAKALAFALGKPLVGVSTLDCIAAQQCQWAGLVCAVIEAGRSELYAACYDIDQVRKSGGEVTYSIRQLGEYLLLAPQQLAIHMQALMDSQMKRTGKQSCECLLFCGEMHASSRQELSIQMGARACFVDQLQVSRHASVLANLAWQRLHDGQEDDPLLLEPLYIRRPSITTSVRQQSLFGTGSPASGLPTII